MTWKDSQSRIIEFTCKCGLLVQTYSRTRKQFIHCSKKADAERTKAQAEREERIRKEAEEKARREEQQRIAAEQAERERLERENQEELERATQKANKEEANIEAATNAPIEQIPVSNQEIQGESKAIKAIQKPSRDSLVLTIAGCYEVNYETAEQWLINEFSMYDDELKAA